MTPLRSQQILDDAISRRDHNRYAKTRIAHIGTATLETITGDYNWYIDEDKIRLTNLSSNVTTMERQGSMPQLVYVEFSNEQSAYTKPTNGWHQIITTVNGNNYIYVASGGFSTGNGQNGDCTIWRPNNYAFITSNIDDIFAKSNKTQFSVNGTYIDYDGNTNTLGELGEDGEDELVWGSAEEDVRYPVISGFSKVVSIKDQAGIERATSGAQIIIQSTG